MKIELSYRTRKEILNKIKASEDQMIDCVNWMSGKQNTEPPDIPNNDELLDEIIDLLNSEQEINENIIEI